MRRRKLARVRLYVRQIAEASGITRTRLSRQADVNYNTVNLYWNDKQNDASLLTLWKLAQALKVEVTDLFEVIPDDSD